MSVHRTQVGDSHIFEKHARHEKLFDPALCLPQLAHNTVAFARDPLERPLDSFFDLCIGLGRPEPVQVSGDAAHIFGYGHMIIV